MFRLIYAVALGLVGAGIVHIVILLLLPYYAERDAWTLISESGPEYSMVQLNRSAAGATVLSDADPLFEVGACRFDLAQGMVHISAAERMPYWSLSLFDRRGINIYSLNDRAASDATLDVVIATPAQLLELRKAAPEEYADSVIVEAEADEAIAVVRSFVPDISWRPSVERNLAATTCELVSAL